MPRKQKRSRGAQGQPSQLIGTAGLLTAREHQVLRLVANGWTSKEVADKLAISSFTVNRHLNDTYRKLRAHNRAEAILVYEERFGLFERIPPPEA